MPKSELLSAVGSFFSALTDSRSQNNGNRTKHFAPKHPEELKTASATLLQTSAPATKELSPFLPSSSLLVFHHLSLCTKSCHVHTHKSIILSAAVSLCWGDGEFSCDQVSPKKAIPMVPKPKSWKAGCGALMGAGHTGRDANVLLSQSAGLSAGAGPC